MYKLRLVAAVFVVLTDVSPGRGELPPRIRIGTLLTEDQKDSDVEMMFKYSVMRVNSDPVLLPNVTLEYDIQYALADDSFHAAKRACSQLESGVFGMFGPSDTMLGAHIQSICNSVDVPHMETRLDVESGDISEEQEVADQDEEEAGAVGVRADRRRGAGGGFSVNLHPSYVDLTRAYKQLMEFLNWTRVAVVYEEDAGLIKMQDLVRGPPDLDMEVYIRQASPRQYRGVLREIKNKAIFNMIVDTKSSSIRQFLRSVLQLQMNDYRYHYIFTSFDTETFDLEDFRYNMVNITAFRLVDSEDRWVQQVLSTINRFQPVGSSIVQPTNVIKAETALMFDSVSVFAHGLHALANGPRLSTPNVTCDLLNTWVDGATFNSYLNSVEITGLTGPIQFRHGKRHSFRLDLLKLMDTGMKKVGSWTVEGGINVTDPNAYYGTGIPNVTLLVTTIQEVPYVMKFRNETNGQEWFEGFCIDLLERIAQIVGFRYEIVEEPGRRFGAYNPETKEWDGLVRTIMDKKTDLAVASMTINYAREGVVDFTKPFMNLGISILFKIPTSQPTRLFSFMNPLAVEIWLYVMAAYILVSLTMFVMARFSPYEWNNPHPCFTDNDIVENQFDISNSFWFITGTLLRQGSGLNPKAMSTRIVGSIWWFFTLIIISSYTANLAAFLTVERTSTPIEGAADLANQEEIEYGTLEGGSTMAFFRDSKIDIYQKMWKFMESRKPSVFVADYEQGVKRVLQGNYAFLMESTGLDYIVQRNCNLTQVGGLLDSKGYGIATPVGSPWRDKISLAILDLQEKGVIQMLYNKWWKDTGDVCNRDEKKKDSKASALGIENIGGVFVVLLCGLALAIIVAILEFCWNSSKSAQTDRQSICTEMANELKFAMRCHAPPQRPALRRSCSRCHNTNTTHVPAPLLGPGPGPASSSAGSRAATVSPCNVPSAGTGGLLSLPPPASLTADHDKQTHNGCVSGGYSYRRHANL